MKLEISKCYQYVDLVKNCMYCNGVCVKNGRSYGKQRYRCKTCKVSFVSCYSYKAYRQHINEEIRDHLREGCGIRSIARLLKISATTVLRRILQLARKTIKPIMGMGKEYELDEMCTHVKKKTRLRWVVYAIRKDTKEVVDFAVGSRTNTTLKQVTDTLLLSNASKVYTDKLPNYSWLLPKEIHCTKRNGTNHIERKNLTLRTHLKRLSRRTICYSKSVAMLAACLKIYFWS